ncbi:MAG: hypothetical protein KC561_15615 [Myxococcales bacterium]|nr:hypothetical protein [Myxococcales bacterium]
MRSFPRILTAGLTCAVALAIGWGCGAGQTTYQAQSQPSAASSTDSSERPRPHSSPDSGPVAITIQFTETPTEASFESLEAIGVEFQRNADGDVMGVGRVFSAVAPAELLETLEARDDIVQVERTDDRMIVLPGEEGGR